MDKKTLLCITFVFVFFFMASALVNKTSALEVPRMTKEELKANLDNRDFIIIDVRTPKDYDSSDRKIADAIRENPMDVTFWAAYPKDKTLVLYCA